MARRDGGARERRPRPDRAAVPDVASSTTLAADDAILTCDSGTIATWAARHWTIRGDRRVLPVRATSRRWRPGCRTRSRAQHAYPGRQVIAFVGDGGFAMLMAEFLTAVAPRAADQGRHQQQRLARPDPVGADGARLPRVRRAAQELRRLRAVGAGLRRARHQGDQAGRPRRRRARRARPRRPRARRLRRQPERAADARRRSATSRPRGSPRRSCMASRTRPRS